jgi:1-deoxy-D-xylulose-5-phosphate synthase
MSALETLRGPADVKAMEPPELSALATEVRDFLVEKVSRTGGHFGPNLGAVELTIALHRVFDSPTDALLFDVGHQSYVHKILTGRAAEFDSLRQSGGLSGYPSRAESEHDYIENSHASTALSYADGMAKAFQLRGEARHAVAVVGDGALTGGMCWEALNNIAMDPDRPVVIVVNDNGRSYAPTIGGLADHLAALRLQPGYERAMEGGKRALLATPVVGRPLYSALHATKAGLKDAIAPQSLFSDLGIKYFGPVDGHDIHALETALDRARAFGGPVIVHAVTRKGNGHAPAENDETDQMHQVSPAAPGGGGAGAARAWTAVFADALVSVGERRPDVTATTAAMLDSTGLDKFAAANPDRCYDVGIAEAHAMTSAAGMATAGLHPVVALYATFLNRAFDQMLMDVALHRLPVTVVLDRAGVTGPDGPSHHGMWDISLLGTVPGIRVAAPRDGQSLCEELDEAVEVSDGPSVLRFPRGKAPADIAAVTRIGVVDLLRTPATPARHDVLVVAVGAFVPLALEVADRLADHGIGVTVADPRWVLPVPDALPGLAAGHALVVSMEDGGRHGGFGWALAAALRDAEVTTPVRDVALPQRFQPHGTRSEVLAQAGLDAQRIARRITEWAVGPLEDRERGSVATAVPEAEHRL